MKIFLARNGVQAGPYSLEQLNNMLATGEVDLNDLMWHEGMDQWVRVGTMTYETSHYTPQTSNNAPDTNKRVSVAELYGNNEPDVKSENTISPAPNPLNKTVGMSKKTGALVANASSELATISSRVLAVVLDQILALLCLIPLLSGMDFDFEKLQAAVQDPALLGTIAETIPTHLATMTWFLIFALFIVQIFLLVKRGQSIGKLITGVRILDVESKNLPSVTNIILIRTVLTNLAYSIPTIGQVILVVDFVMMVIDKQRRSLHDKVAKTYVVKARPSQLNKK